MVKELGGMVRLFYDRWQETGQRRTQATSMTEDNYEQVNCKGYSEKRNEQALIMASGHYMRNSEHRNDKVKKEVCFQLEMVIG
jgi:hypothetical protein